MDFFLSIDDNDVDDEAGRTRGRVEMTGGLCNDGDQMRAFNLNKGG